MGEARATRVPSIGRIVIFKSATKEDLPAIVVKVHSPTTVNLKVFPDSGGPDSYQTSVIEGTTIGCWHWPEMV